MKLRYEAPFAEVLVLYARDILTLSDGFEGELDPVGGGNVELPKVEF